MKPYRKPIRKVSKRQQERLKEYRKVREAYLKEHPLCKCCQVVAAWSGVKTVAASEDIHHRFGKAGSLLCDVRGFLGVCRKHHDYIHNNPREAREWGWIAPKFQWNNPKVFDMPKQLEQYSNE